MERKAFFAQSKFVGERSVEGIAAVFGNVDNHGDIVHRGAFKKTLQENIHRVKHLWMHNMMDPPTAVIQEMEEVGVTGLPEKVRERYPEANGGLRVVREYLDTPRGNEILLGIKAGAITEMSFGYDPIKFDYETIGEDKNEMLVRNLREVRLWDVSDVTFGANPATSASKTALPYKDTGVADEQEVWATPALEDFTDQNWEELSDAQKSRIAAHYAWGAAAPPENFSDLKLPHHLPSKTGVGPVVWKGITAAMQALQSTEIPSSDRKGVHNHLAKHYQQYNKEAPDYKLVQLVAEIREAEMALLSGQLKAGRVLSSRNLNRLKDAIAVLEEILSAAEPLEDDEKSAALTEQLTRERALLYKDLLRLDPRLVLSG